MALTYLPSSRVAEKPQIQKLTGFSSGLRRGFSLHGPVHHANLSGLVSSPLIPPPLILKMNFLNFTL